MSVITVTDSYIENGAVRLHAEQAGSELPALVFTHYYGGTSRTWHPVMERLSNSARTVAFDFRGWGKSSKPNSGYAVADLAADMSAVVDGLGLTDYIVVGHSMGGKIAQLFASQRPSGLRGLLLVAPVPAVTLPIPEAARE